MTSDSAVKEASWTSVKEAALPGTLTRVASA
jgi:hypothetical protein